MSNEAATQKKQVDITEDCNAPDVELDPTASDELTWYSHGSKFIVNFKGKSPFSKNVFHVPANDSCDSGPITTSSEGSYKYHISNEKGVEVDPAVIIKRAK